MKAAYVRAASLWDADVGPPRAELLPRAERLAAGFSTRILAHVLDEIALQTSVELSSVPWVVAAPTFTEVVHALGSLPHIVGLTHAVTPLHADAATVPMATIEAMGTLIVHSQVLLVFVQDAKVPTCEAKASALLLSRECAVGDRLCVRAPALLRGGRPGGNKAVPSIDAANSLARAALVREPTIQTVRAGGMRAEQWCVELMVGP